MKKYSDIIHYNFDGELKVGVISDFQLSPILWEKNTTFQKNLVQSLKCLKQQGCQMIIVAGDICNSASKVAYSRFADSLKAVFGSELPLVQCIMGNHDYYASLHTRNGCRLLFESCLKQKAYSHLTVNGFHFIGASPSNGKMDSGYKDVLPWLKEQLDIASKDSTDKPIFVTVHSPAKDTVYGSDMWYDKYLDDLLKLYPNVVCFSGHTHYSLVDERGFCVKDYTSICTQSLSYVELEKGKTNGSVPPNAYCCPMGLIMDFQPNAIEVKRFSFLTQKEEKANKRWKIPYCFSYANRPPKSTEKPQMPDKAGKQLSQDSKGTVICFTAGTDNDFVHSYKVVFDDETTQLYYSDFYLGIENMKKEVHLKLYNKKPGIYNIKIFAINSNGIESTDYTEIKNVRINSLQIYRRVLAPEIKY